MMDSNWRLMVRGLNSVDIGVVSGLNAVVSGLVMNNGGNNGLVMRGSLVHLLSHELLEKRLGDLNVLDTGVLLKNCLFVVNWGDNSLVVNWGGNSLVMDGGSNGLVMSNRCLMLRGADVSDLGLGSVLGCLDVANSWFLDIAGLRSVVRLRCVAWLNDISGLSVSRLSIHWLLDVTRLSVDGLTVVRLVGCIGRAADVVSIVLLFFSGRISRNDGSEDERGETSHLY